MGWTSIDLRIEMNTAESANNAVEIIKNYATANASAYLGFNVEQFINDVSVVDNTVIIDDSYSIGCSEYFEFIPVMCKAIAEANPTTPFNGKAFATSGYSEDVIHEISFNKTTLHVTSLYFAEGDDYCCADEDCHAFICTYEDSANGKTFVCPECGKEYTFEELDGELPDIEEHVWVIA